MIKGVGQAEALVEVGLCLGTRRTDFVSYGAEAVPKRRVAVGKGGRGTAAFISVAGTSVRAWTRRSTIFVRSAVAGVWQIGKSELDDAGATVALAAPMTAPLPPDMASPMSEPRKTMPPRLMAVVENRVSRDRCVMIPSKNPQRYFAQINSFAEPTRLLHACHRTGTIGRSSHPSHPVPRPGPL